MMTAAMRSLALMLACAAMLLVLGWTAGCVLNDRWGWSQWLWWIPAPLAFLGALVWIVSALLVAPVGARRWGTIAAGTALVITAGASMRSFSLVSHAYSPNAVHIVCWNARWPGEQARTIATALVPWAGCVMIISNPGRMIEHASLWMREGEHMAEAGTFLLTGPVRVIEARPVVQGDDGFATLFRFEAPGTGATSVLAVDLPSSPFRPRFAALARFAAQVRASVDLGTVDLIVGDFNCTRGSASVHEAFPGFHDAWSAAGQGWGASWPRETALLHIDLALASDRIRVERCELHDPGVGYHRINALSCIRPNR
jgi:hypothetical protein